MLTDKCLRWGRWVYQPSLTELCAVLFDACAVEPRHYCCFPGYSRGSRLLSSSNLPSTTTAAVGSTATTTVISSSTPSTTPFRTPYRSKYLSARHLDEDDSGGSSHSFESKEGEAARASPHPNHCLQCLPYINCSAANILLDTRASAL